MINRALTGVCEISTGTFTVTERPPVYVGENGALAITVTFKNNGSDADLSGLNANMYLYYPGMSHMTESIDMTISGSTATGRFVEELTVESGWPLLVIQLVNYDTSELIVACAQPIQITETRGDVVITTRPPTPSEIVYVGRSPYVDPVTHHWMEWDADAGRYADTGISPTGIASITKTGTSGNVDTYTITLSDGSTSTFTVTNGASIASIAKTGTSGLTDTYTVALTDGSTTTFTVTNGRSITNISKTGTSGNVDTYTITYNDSTTSSFTVTNGAVTSVNTQTGDVVIPNATESADGLLSSSDKSKLDGLPLAAYPVGSYYWSEDSTSPATKFGGTWTQITTGGAIVLEQGTSNIWTYRKFSDGVAECWGQTSYSVSSWSAFGNVHEANPGHYIDYPTNLFIDTPILNVTSGVYDGAVMCIETYTGHSKLRTPTMYGIRPDSGGSTTKVVIQMHAIGAWRNQHTPFYLWVRTA